MIDSVPIVFTGGSYGNYLAWLLDNFTSSGRQLSPELPYGLNGNSHDTVTRCANVKYFELDQTVHYDPFFRIHPGRNNYETYINDILLPTFNKTIAISVNDDDLIIVYNNFFLKDPNGFYTMFNKNKRVDALREDISYRYFNQNISFVTTSTEHCLVLNLNDILYNIEKTLFKVCNFLNTNIVHNMDLILSNHNIMIELQTELNKGKEMAQFINDFKNCVHSLLPKNCTIVDEAYIQKYLRDELNLEIKCHNLEIFPKTTTELHKITFPAEEMIQIG